MPEDEPVDGADPELALEPEPVVELRLPAAPVELLPVAGLLLFFFIPAASSLDVVPDVPEPLVELLCVPAFLPLPIDVELPDPIELDDIETPNALAVLLSSCPDA